MCSKYKDKEVLITGGLGMLGSTIANKLVPLGAKVTLMDAFLEPYGANIFNIKDIYKNVKVNVADIRDVAAVKYLVKDKDVIFNLAGQVSHNDSIEDPYLDTDINYMGHLNVLEACKRINPKAVVIHPGSRLQYGQVNSIPVKEDVPLNPMTPYAVNKTSSENLYLFYYRTYEVPVILFRLANPYGPRCQMKHSKYSIVNWFIRQAFDDKELTIFGDGNQIRDYIFADDVADAFINTAFELSAYGEVFNVGSGKGTSFGEMVEMIVDIIGRGRIKNIAWPDNYVNVETGDFIADIEKISNVLNWNPKVSIREGIEKTVLYYEKYKRHYWD